MMAEKLPVEFDPIRKQLFVENMMLRLSPVDAARVAGFTTNLANIAKKLLADEDVCAMIEGYKQQLIEKYDVSRERVLQNLVDATEMARVQADPKSMVMALKEVSEVQGYHAPRQVSMNSSVNITTSNAKSRLRHVTDAELAELAGEGQFEAVQLIPSEAEYGQES